MYIRKRAGRIAVATAVFLSFSQESMAASLICKSQNKWLKNWYDLEYVQLDKGKSTARLGANDFWLETKPTTITKIAIGTKLSWRQTLTVTNPKNKGKEFTFDFNLRLKDDGEADLFMCNMSGRSWELPMVCK